MSKSKTIAFRLTDEEFALVEKAAAASGKNPNDWCRDSILEKANGGTSMNAVEAILFEELAKVRYLVGIGFGLLSTDELTQKSWNETKQQVDNFGERIAAQILARRKNKS